MGIRAIHSGTAQKSIGLVFSIPNGKLGTHTRHAFTYRFYIIPAPGSPRATLLRLMLNQR